MPVLASLAAYRDRSYPCELRVERHMGCKSGASLSSWAAFLRMSHPSGAGQRVYELRGIPIKSSAPRCPLVHHGRNSVHRVRRRLNGVTHQRCMCVIIYIYTYIKYAFSKNWYFTTAMLLLDLALVKSSFELSLIRSIGKLFFWRPSYPPLPPFKTHGLLFCFWKDYFVFTDVNIVVGHNYPQCV